MSQIAVFDLTLCLLIASTLLSLPWRGALRSLLQSDPHAGLRLPPRPQPAAAPGGALRRGPHRHHGAPVTHPTPHHHRYIPRGHAYRGHDPRP
ncbi:MAG: hypothetical protein KGK15_03330 [Burkholderiales bacterium]|nr:hypothetical protein [Burkholderiales bacterium]MDE2610043.1 hypothetical protein [Burkholderiales bacterium]